MFRDWFLSCSFILFYPATIHAQDAPWNDLLESGGEALSGDWELAGGVLTGRTRDHVAAWWQFPGDYWDFELEAGFRTPVPCNGGLQFRSHRLPVFGRPPDASGEYPRGFYGYQANIETRAKDGTGAIVEENGRGRIVAPANDAQPLVKESDWNTMTVRAVGPVIEVAINGVTATRLHDEAWIGGGIALQVLSFETGAEATIQYRNVRIRDLGRAGNWRPLFNGKDLAGWKNWGSEDWSVRTGVIQGRRGPKESEGYLATEETWGNFRIRGRFRMLGDGNYGLFFHSTIRLREDGYPVISGVQGEVEPEYPGQTGWFYESYRRGWIVEQAKNDPLAYALRPGEWNEIEIRCTGNRLTSWVNGARILDFHDPTPQLFHGSFALQLHTGQGAGIDWKDLYVEE